MRCWRFDGISCKGDFFSSEVCDAEFYWIIRNSEAPRYPLGENEDSTAEFPLTIVTSCYTTKRLSLIERLLESIADQNYTNFETVIVVDGSGDALQAILRLCSFIRVPNASIMFSKKNIGASASKNMGANAARGEIVGFVDDDVMLFQDWAFNVVDAFEKRRDIVGLSGPTLPLWINNADSWFPEDLYWIISCTGWIENEFKEIRNIWTMNSAVRRKAFFSCGGFKEYLGPLKGREAGYSSIAEDLELSLRLKSDGSKIYFTPLVKCLHHIQHSQVSLDYITRRSIWIGRSRRMLERLGIKQDVEKGILIRIFKRYARDTHRKDRHVATTRSQLALLVSLASLLVGYGVEIIHL